MELTNLAKPMNSTDWKQWSPDVSLLPVLEKKSYGRRHLSDGCIR